jgi:hypothetical protein
MPLPHELESLTQEWHEINLALAGLAADRSPAGGAGTWVEPSPEEAALLERLDEIEFVLGEEELDHRRTS